MKDVVDGNNRFAVDLYGKVRDRPGNLFYSPYSISTALALTFAGARGATAKEMASTLHFPSDQESLHSGFAALHALMGPADPKRPYRLDSANALWGQSGLGYRPDFLQRAELRYGASLHTVDFHGDPEAARLQINSWLASQTLDKIKDLLAPQAITTATDLVLTNAIYFKGAWLQAFAKGATRDEPFDSAGSSSKVPTMHQTESFRYLESPDFQALELPYVGNDLAMVVILPVRKDGLSRLEAGLSGPTLDGWIARMAKRRVEVALPRFKLEQGMELAEILGLMGMPTAFTSKADFSGMTDDRKLFLSKVIHKAFVEVNEEGTEAAAATAVMAVRTQSAARPVPPAVFRADHPFLFLIRDTRTGSTLFLGRVVQP